jgi:hypothetical protein
MEITPTLFAVHREIKNQPSFALIPLSLNCPFVEVIYDPTKRILYVIGKNTKEDPQFLERLDDNGTPMANTKDKNVARMERRIFAAYYEYRITQSTDITDFIKKFVVNPTHGALLKMLSDIII